MEKQSHIEVSYPFLKRLRLPFRGRSRRVSVRRFPPLFPAVIILLAVVAAIFGEQLAPHSPVEPDFLNRLSPPVWVDGGMWKYPLGTDSLGRDVLSRIIVGSRISMTVAVAALGIAALVGVAVAIATAYYSRAWLSTVLLRIVDSLVPIPVIFIGLIIAAVYGPSMPAVVTSLAVIAWARFCRGIRGDALRIMEMDYVAMAKVEGCSSPYIMVRHVFPNLVNTLIVLFTLLAGWAILVEASLSFLGAGVPPPAPSWGRMVSSGQDHIISGWWISSVPGAAILLVVLAFNQAGDWLRDRLDPNLEVA
ncbi:MAG: ABC transporter permease [Trueperaceae bacterium]